MLTLSLENLTLRLIEPSGSISTNAELQAWNADHLGFRWKQAQKLNEKLMAGAITLDDWYEAMDGLLLEGHANAWWIGRSFAGDDSEFGDLDMLYGRAFRDAETEYLLGFYDRIKDGQYQDAEGNWMPKKLNANSRLYIGKMRGTSGQAFVDGSDDDTLFYWKTSAIEEHCLECPEYVGIFDGVKKGELFTTPGAGDTPCLGNCLCYLEAVAGSVVTVSPMAVDLNYEQESDSAAA